jgi:hypothetical protein
MGKNQACQSQVHVTALWCLRVKPRNWGLNRRLKPVLQGGGGAGSHTLPHHVIGKWTVNMTLVKGHHTQTQHTARNFHIFSHDSSIPINKLYIIIFDWEDEHS